MNEANQQSKWHVGMRNVKTAIAATLTALIYLPFQRNPTFACIGAVFGLGSDMGNSWLNGGNRLFGTIFGGLIGMALFSLYIQVYPEGGFHPLILPLLFIGAVALIVVSNIFHWPGAIQPGGVMLCILLFNQPVESYIPYSINRIIDTGIGVVIAMGVNLLLPRERLVRWLEALHFRKSESKLENK